MRYQELQMKCVDCGKDVEELTYLTDYGRTARGTKDNKGRCTPCDSIKFPPLPKRKTDEEINNEE